MCIGFVCTIAQNLIYIVTAVITNTVYLATYILFQAYPRASSVVGSR